ncbi:MAG: putative bifunctional diguanylate cyclase/phosphodiesterase [Vulcanimicrobiota bacterium]
MGSFQAGDKAEELLAGHPDGIIVLQDKRVLYANRAVDGLLMQPVEEIDLALLSLDSRPDQIDFPVGKQGAVSLELRWETFDWDGRPADVLFLRRPSGMPILHSEILADYERRAGRAEERARVADERFRSIFEKSGKAAEKVEAAEARAARSEEASAEAERRLLEALERAEGAELQARRAEERTHQANLRFRRIYEMSGVEELERRAEEAETRAEEAQELLREVEEIKSMAEEQARWAEERARLADERVEEADERLRVLYEDSGADSELLQELEEINHRLVQEMRGVKLELEELRQKEKRLRMVAEAGRFTISKLEKQLVIQREKLQRTELTMRDAVDRARILERRLEPESQLERLAFEDPLTGLPDFTIFTRLLETAIGAAKDGTVLMTVDLDRFRVVNDTLGSRTGDRVLTEVASRLRLLARDSDLLGRRREDQFLLAVLGDEAHGHASVVAESVLEALRRPFEIDGQVVKLSASLGLADAGQSAEEYLSRAELALAQAKENGRDRLERFSAETEQRRSGRAELEGELVAALAESQLALYYQPIYEIEQERLIGLEALLRWRHPTRGLLTPDRFLEVALKVGLIVPIGEWVLTEACRQAGDLPGDIYVSVNVSPHQVIQAEFAQQVLEAVEMTAIPPSKLVVEVPEGVHALAPDHAAQVVQRLAEGGVGLGIDDFGSGYTSLKQLEPERLRFLKLDRTLVMGLPDDPHCVAMSRAVLGLAQSLGVDALAEGVETQQQLDFVRELGCRLVQGYWFSPPVPDSDVAALVEQE